MAVRPTEDHERDPRSERLPEEDERLDDLELASDEATDVEGGGPHRGRTIDAILD